MHKSPSDSSTYLSVTPAETFADTCRHLPSCGVCVEVLFSMLYILSQALGPMFPIFNQGHRVDNQHPGASPQSCQFCLLSPFDGSTRPPPPPLS